MFKTLAECQTHAVKRAAETGLTVAIEERYPDGWWVIDTAEPPEDGGVWVAEYESRNFSFLAVGHTKAEAYDAMIRTLTLHGEQYGCEPEWFRSRLDGDVGMNVFRVLVGGLGVRDYSQMIERGE